MKNRREYSVDEAIQAQRALRELAGMAPEMFPVESFVGMISDEIEQLRAKGHSDETIARTIKAASKIEISAAEIAAHYASPVERGYGHQH